MTTKTTCPGCGLEFVPPPRDTLRLRALKLLARYSHTEMATCDVAREIRPNFDDMTYYERHLRVRSTYSFLNKMKNGGSLVARRRIGNDTYWRITQGGIGYLLAKNVIGLETYERYKLKIEKREFVIAVLSD